MIGDVIDFELRTLHIQYGDDKTGVLLQMRKLRVINEQGTARYAEWSDWDDVPAALHQTASRAALQRMSEERGGELMRAGVDA